MFGLDIKCNKIFNYYGSILRFLTMRQGPNESNDLYMNHFTPNDQTLEMSGRYHIFCSPYIVKNKIIKQQLMKSNIGRKSLRLFVS